MKTQPTRPPVALLVVVALAGLWFATSTTPPPAPDRPDGPDLLSVFTEHGTTQQSYRDAIAFGVLCESLAGTIEYDGQRGEEARLLTGAQLDDLRRWSREYYMLGESFGQKYPRLPDLVGEFLDQNIGESGGPVNDAMREKWIKAHKQLAACSLWAARQMQK